MFVKSVLLTPQHCLSPVTSSDASRQSVASDSQMDGAQSLADQTNTAAQIYEKYGYWTTVCSAIATWAVIAGD